MKTIIKTTSLFLCLLLLLSSVISCARSEVNNTESEATQVPDTTSSELTIENLTAEFVDGEYTLDDTPVRPHELLTALYRIAGEPEASWDYDVDWVVGKKEDYFFDASIWSAFQAGIIPFVVKQYGKATGMSFRLANAFFVRDCTIAEAIDKYTDAEITSIECFLNFDTEITRSDAVLAMYYYSFAYLKKDVSANDALRTIADRNLLTEKHSERYKMYIGGSSNVMPNFIEDLSASWNWALDAGIAEPYDDNTLRPDTTLTRAEFATMLTRFMDYVK